MSEREVLPGWTIHLWDGGGEPMAFGPRDITLDVNDDDTITIEHQVATERGGSCSERVTVPIRWVSEYIAEVLAHRAKKAASK